MYKDPTEQVKVEIANQPKCPNCHRYRLQQQLNPKWMQCLACGATYYLTLRTPGKIGRHK